MDHFKYLIVGGGMTADAAVKAIRRIDADGAIGIVSAEHDVPYKRPPLSKSLWKGKPEDSIWLKTQDLGVSMFLGRIATGLDPAHRLVTDNQGGQYEYEKLLLATGGTPRHMATGDGIIYYRTYRDYQRLRKLADPRHTFIVIGGGFIGSEIAAALAPNSRGVTLIFPDTGIGAKVYPKELSTFLVGYYREHGIEVLTGDVVTSVEPRGGMVEARTQSRRVLEADAIVAGIGISPNISLAQSAGLPVDNGIVVGPHLNAGDPDIFAAGDVARFYNPLLERHIRVEHEDNAVTMGSYAGASMAGEPKPYDYLPYFYSDLFDLGYEAVGELDVSLNETIADWKEPFREGVVYYVREGRVRGVLLWNVWDKVPAARELIAQPGPFTADDLRGRITA